MTTTMRRTGRNERQDVFVIAPLAELIGKDEVLLDVDASSREALLAKAAQFLAARHNLPERAIVDALSAREALGSTALGHGVALPHARMASVHAPVAVFLKTRAPIAFDAPDGRPVGEFLVLLVPSEAAERYLAFMGCAARQFGDRDFRVRLKAATSAASIARLFEYLPDTPTGENATT
jgi:nitrogen PTS system EIIA component